MNHPPGSFPAVYRLKNKAEFDRVFTRPNQRCSEGVLQAIYKAHESLPDNQHEGHKSRAKEACEPAHQHRQAPDCGARLGLIVAKRFIPLAVHRNHIKRLIREGFRTHRQQLPAVDVIVRIVRKPKHKVTAGEVRALFGKMQRAQRS